MSTAPAKCAGDTAVIVLDETPLKLVAGTVPNDTAVTPAGDPPGTGV